MRHVHGKWMAHGVGMGIIQDMKDIKAMALGQIKGVEGIKCMHGKYTRQRS